MQCSIAERYQFDAIMPLEQITDSWFFSGNDEEIFVKVNDLRVKNRQGRLLEDVLDVKDAGNAQKSQIVVRLCLFVNTASIQADRAFLSVK